MKTMQNLNNDKLKVTSQSHCMLSYSWANKKYVDELVMRLEPYVHFWRDKANLSGSLDLWTAIANAIHKSEFVIAFLTADYVASDSCTNELNYALNIKKPVVPVFIDATFKPTGNVGLRTSQLFYIVYNDIIESPILFIKHLNAMSAKIHNVDLNSLDEYQATYLKYNIKQIEQMISKSVQEQIFDFHNQDNKTYNLKHYLNDDNNNESYNLLLRNQSLTNHINDQSSNKVITSNKFLNYENESPTSSLNVYGMQTKVNGKMVDCVDLKIEYKQGDSMCYAKENPKDTTYSFKDKLSLKEHKNKNEIKNPNALESNIRKGFYIHQTAPDIDKFDLYTKEKDDHFSFVCHGKPVEILDSDYQDINDYVAKPKENVTLELILELNSDIISGFIHIEDDLMLLVTEKAEFNLLKPNKSKLAFVRCVLSPKFNDKDIELYKQGKKVLVDICLDSNGNLLTLNRWHFNEPYQIEHKYTIELLKFDRKKVDGICYQRTICCLTNDLQPFKHPNETKKQSSSYSKNENKSVSFVRIYNDEKTQCIILIDQSNDKIYWFKKSNGSKKRCLKSNDTTLKDPKSVAIIDNFNEMEIIFVCTKAGLILSTKNFTINHEISMPVDICYDTQNKSIYFISSYKIYEGYLFDKKHLVNLSPVSNGVNDSSASELNKKLINIDIKYKLLFSCFSMENKRDLKRIATSKNFIFILCGPEYNSKSCKALIYAYSKVKT